MAYIYQAALWCDDCGEAIRKRLNEAGEGPEDPGDETSYDSDDYPKGPSPDDDESDSPNHCESGAECPNAILLDDGTKVGAIVSGLTDEGIAYVRGAKDSPCVRAWRAHYELEPITVHLDNLDDRDGCVMVTVSGPGAHAWAMEDQTIAGARWEGDRDDFAYAMPADHPGLVAELESEGYTLNLDEYSPPEDEEGLGGVEPEGDDDIEPEPS
jgi:hypothetical protein